MGMESPRWGAALTSGLFCIFGVSSWVTVNGIFAQLPLLAARQPAGWTLGSHLGLAVQLANVGPALYIGHRRCPQARVLTVPTAIYAVLTCSLLSMIALVRCPGPVACAPHEHRLLARLSSCVLRE